jgi:arylsulfatase
MARDLQWASRLHQAFLASALLITAIPTSRAQQINGVPGSPDATTTIHGRYLPPPPQPFTGRIELNAAQSKPAWPRAASAGSFTT